MASRTNRSVDDDHSTLNGRGRRDIRALIVEDEPADVTMIERVLSRIESYRIHTSVAPDLKTARDVASRERFDVAFIDYDLGGACGVDIVPILAESGSCASVLLTGQLTSKVHERALAAGVLASLSKDRLDVTLVEAAMRQAFRLRELSSDVVRRASGVERSLLNEFVAGTPTHLLPALQVMHNKSAGLTRKLESTAAEASVVRDARMLSRIVGDLAKYCTDTMKIVSRLDEEMDCSGTVDVQGVLLDALNIIYADRRRHGIRFRIDLNDTLLAVRASESALRLALVDMLSVVIDRVMPGAHIQVSVLAEHGSIAIALTCDDIAAAPSEIRLNTERLATRCRALLRMFGGHAVLFDAPREDGHLATVWLPLAKSGSRQVRHGDGEKNRRRAN